MLAELRKRIEELTRARKYPTRGKISRVFSLVLSPSLSHFQDRYSERFPVPEGESAILSPWIIFRGKEGDFEKEVREAVGNSFDASRITRVRAEGISLWDPLNQVLVIADLCEPDACDRIVKGCRIFREAVHGINPGIPLFFVGIFFLRRSTTRESAREVDYGETFHREVLQSGFFERVFLLDISNPSGAWLSEEDQLCLAGHLVYFLTTYPLLAESPGEYLDWLRQGRPQEGITSGFSSFSLVLPIDQILEAVAVATGSEIMEGSFLTEPPADRYQLYLENFLQTLSLLNIDEVTRNISAVSGFVLRDPAAALPEFSVLGPDDYLGTMGALDASLPGAAKENGELMGKIGEKRLPDLKESLEAHLEAMITREGGGLLVAKAFLEELQKHLDGIIPKEIPEAKYSDPAGHIQHIRIFLEKGPRKESLYARGVVLGLVSAVVSYSLPVSPLFRILLTAGTPVLSLGLAAFASHAANYKLQTSILRLESVLREKWRKLMEPERVRAAKILLEKVREKVAGAREEIDSAIVRVKELVEYFWERYSPPLPEELAVWKYVLGDRGELLEMRRLCRSDVSRVARDYLEGDRPLSLWQRLSRPGAGEPGRWEWNILEKAGIRVLPDCGEIVNLHVLSVLDGDRTRFHRLQNALLGGADPFLCLRPGSEVPQRRAVLEAGTDSRHPITRELEKSLGGMFRVQRVNESSSYRLSLFGFLESVRFDGVQRSVST